MSDHDGDSEAMQAYYAKGEERDRLARGVGQVEFLRTIEVVSRTLPDPPAVVADIGGGPGRYTDWLLGAGYTVVHRDPVLLHVEQIRKRHSDAVDSAVDSAVDTAVGDARALDLADASVDVVLLLGPLYHLPVEADRLQALAEAGRIVRPGGVVHLAAITRWSPRLHGILVNQAHTHYAGMLATVDEVERTGVIPPVGEGSFTGYTHTPDGLRQEVARSGLVLESLVSIEGLAMALGDIDERMDSPEGRALVLDTLRAVEAVPELLGVGPHLLATARAGSA